MTKDDGYGCRPVAGRPLPGGIFSGISKTCGYGAPDEIGIENWQTPLYYWNLRGQGSALGEKPLFLPQKNNDPYQILKRLPARAGRLFFAFF
jgi:hypothetical protein